jgi:hypothetical protein
LQAALPEAADGRVDLVASRAAALSAAGNLLAFTGDPERAEPMLREARDAYRGLLRLDAANPEWVAGLAATLERIANLSYWRGDLDEAFAVAREGLGLERHPPTDNAFIRAAELTAHAEVLLIKQDHAAARPLLETALELVRAAVARLAKNDALRSFAARPLRRLGAVLTAQGDHAGASAVLREALTLAEADIAREPDSLYAKMFGWEAAMALGAAAQETDDPDAMLWLSKAEALAERSLKLDPQSRTLQLALASAQVKKAQLHLDRGHFLNAELTAEPLADVVAADDPRERGALDWMMLRAEVQTTLGEIARARGAAAAAVERDRAALAILNRGHERFARFPGYHDLRSRALFGLAQAQADGVKARELAAEALFHLDRAEARLAPLRPQRLRREALQGLLDGRAAAAPAVGDGKG